MFASCLQPGAAPCPTLFSYLSGRSFQSGFGSSTDVHSVVQAYAAHAQGRVFLITGAASHIARELCSALVQHGATVVLGHRGDMQAGTLLAGAVMSAARTAAAKEAAGAAPAAEAKAAQSDDKQPPTSLQTSTAKAPEACVLGQQANAVCGHAVPLLCDLSSFASTRACADAFAALGLPLHVLVHCASINTSVFHLNSDGFETHFAVNHLNPLLLTLLLLPRMVASQSEGAVASSQAPSLSHTIERDISSAVPVSSSCPQACTSTSIPRIVWATCSAHHITYLPQRGAWTGRRLAWHVQGQHAGLFFAGPQAFGSSKLACILAARELASRAAAGGLQIAALAAHPGITTEGLKKYGGLEPGGVLHAVQAAFADGMHMLGTLKTPAQAAATLAYAALAPEVLVEGAQVQGITRSSADVAAAQQAHEAGPECSKAYERLMPQEQQQEQQQQPAVLHRYLEDCAPSRPSLNARNEEEAARLYEMSVRWLLPHLEHDAHKLPVALLPGAAAVMLSGQSDKLR